MTLLNATDAIKFVTTSAQGVADPKPATIADNIGRAIASRYEYLSTWGAGRALTPSQEADIYEAIGVLRLEYYRLTGRAWLAA